jgi:hypothetical protein
VAAAAAAEAERAAAARRAAGEGVGAVVRVYARRGAQLAPLVASIKEVCDCFCIDCIRVCGLIVCIT